MARNLLKKGSKLSTSKNDIFYGGESDYRFYGGAGNDVIYGGAGSKRLDGGVGKDTIFTSGDGDFVFGGSGNDVIFSTMDNGRIWADAGNDTIRASGHDVHIDGGAGNDQITVLASQNTLILGGEGNDTITTDSSSGSIIYGGAGNDRLVKTGDPSKAVEFRFAMYNYKAQGWSINWGGTVLNESDPAGINKKSTSGKDTVVGFVKGVDKLVFEKNFGDHATVGTFRFLYSGNNTIVIWSVGKTVMASITVLGVWIDSSDLSVTQPVLQGTSGDNEINGTEWNDRILGDAGNDTISAFEGGADTIYGGEGNDKISVGGASGRYYGDAGDDTIGGYSEFSTTYGGDGNDKISVWGEKALIYGGAGDDLITAGDGDVYGGDGNDTIDMYTDTNPSTSYGGAGDDSITAEGGNVYGGSGNDTISLSAGADPSTIYGGDGDDLIFFYTNSSAVFGGDGNDTIFDFSASSVSTVDGGAGDDVIVISGAQFNYEINLSKTLNQGNDIVSNFKSGIDKLNIIGNSTDNIQIELTYIPDAGATVLVITANGVIVANITIFASERLPVTLDDIVTSGFNNIDTSGKIIEKTIDEAGYYILSDSAEIVKYTGLDEAKIVLAGGNDTFLQQTETGFVVVDGGAGDDTFTMVDGGELAGGEGADTFEFVGFGKYAALITDFELGVDHLVFKNLPNRDFVDKLGMEFTLAYDDYLEETSLQLNGVTLVRFSGDYRNTSLLDDITVANNNILYTGRKIAGYSGDPTTGFNVSEVVTNLTGGKLSFSGGGGNDTMFAGFAGDTMNGGIGDDVLVGGTGKDKLTGGSGKDTFAFNENFGVDHVTDFTIGEDHLWFVQGVFSDIDALLAAVSVVKGHIQITQGTNAIIFDNLTGRDLDNFKNSLAETTFAKHLSDAAFM